MVIFSSSLCMICEISWQAQENSKGNYFYFLKKNHFFAHCVSEFCKVFSEKWSFFHPASLWIVRYHDKHKQIAKEIISTFWKKNHFLPTVSQNFARYSVKNGHLFIQPLYELWDIMTSTSKQQKKWHSFVVNRYSLIPCLLQKDI